MMAAPRTAGLQVGIGSSPSTTRRSMNGRMSSGCASREARPAIDHYRDGRDFFLPAAPGACMKKVARHSGVSALPSGRVGLPREEPMVRRVTVRLMRGRGDARDLGPVGIQYRHAGQDADWRSVMAQPSGPVTSPTTQGNRPGSESSTTKFMALVSISPASSTSCPSRFWMGAFNVYVVEIIKRGPVPGARHGDWPADRLALLLMLMAFAFYNDINRLISGS